MHIWNQCLCTVNTVNPNLQQNYHVYIPNLSVTFVGIMKLAQTNMLMSCDLFHHFQQIFTVPHERNTCVKIPQYLILRALRSSKISVTFQTSHQFQSKAVPQINFGSFPKHYLPGEFQPTSSIILPRGPHCMEKILFFHKAACCKVLLQYWNPETVLNGFVHYNIYIYPVATGVK